MSSNGGKTYSNWISTNSNSYTFGNLSPGTTYTFKVEVTDNAGNLTTSYESSATTKVSIPDGEDYITFDYSPRDWTNGDVTITITSTAGSKYTIQYSLDGYSWYTYSSYSKPVRSSNGPVYARLSYNGNYGEEATGNVTKIDKTNPSGWTSYNTYGDYAIITVGTSDTGGSGVSTSYNTTTSNITKQSNTQYRVTANGTYYFIVYDNARNSSTFSCTVSGIEDKELLVGDYVNYTPNGSSYTSLTTDDLGVSQTVYREDLDYQVLGINGNYATLLSMPTSTRILGRGTTFYNNMVYVLNNTAKTLYSNSSLGVTARNIKIADVTDKIQDDYNYHIDDSYIGYGNSQYLSNVYYPNIYLQEYNGNLAEDEQYEKYSGYSYSSGIQITNTYFTSNNSEIRNHMKPAKTQNSSNDYNIYYNMLVNASLVTRSYYYANRTIFIMDGKPVFSHRWGPGFAAFGLPSSEVANNPEMSQPKSMRIIIENVPISRINLNSGSGTQSSPWGIN